jgi:hypothetical protein
MFYAVSTEAYIRFFDETSTQSGLEAHEPLSEKRPVMHILRAAFKTDCSMNLKMYGEISA